MAEDPARGAARLRVAGILLAAGAGSRMGHPKALVRDERGTPWVVRALEVMRSGGVDDTTVVLGASAPEARLVLDSCGVPARVVVATDWERGMGASLRAGLHALDEQAGAGPAVEAALVMLVDLPDVGPDVIERVLGAAREAAAAGRAGKRILVRARFAGRPGHPVVLGRAHWPAIVAGPPGDRGARDHLSAHHVLNVECGDLARGRDVDTPG